jgi:S-adenosylmethionine/arginine decarboxylase-like enzyme
MFDPYHQHLLVKCTFKNQLREVEKLNKWFRDLVEKVGMKVVAGPTSVMVSEPGNEGLTGTVTLATSHASIHIWDEVKPYMLQFDIYSCKCFDVNVVLEHMNDTFDIIEYQWMQIDRNDKLKVSETGFGNY